MPCILACGGVGGWGRLVSGLFGWWVDWLIGWRVCLVIGLPRECACSAELVGWLDLLLFDLLVVWFAWCLAVCCLAGV